VQYSA